MYNSSKDKIGIQVGDYIIESYSRNNGKHTWFNARCVVCGRVKEIRSDGFKYEHKHDRCINLVPSSEYKRKIIQTFKGINTRCNGTHDEEYKKLYLDKGIKNEFNCCIDFYDYMIDELIIHMDKYGSRNTSIDRIDSNGNYSKGNVRWATPKQQSRNLSSNVYIKIEECTTGKVVEGYSLAEIEEKTGIKAEYFTDLRRGKRKTIPGYKILAME